MIDRILYVLTDDATLSLINIALSVIIVGGLALLLRRKSDKGR